MYKPISITAVASISPLGTSLSEAWNNYKSPQHHISENTFQNITALVAQIPETSQKFIETLRQSDNKYKSLDNTVLYAMYASREAIKNAGWNGSDNFGINIGSSRGATHLFETYYDDFLKNNKAQTLSSPTTTLGNISSWVAHDLQTQGPEISHSITCSTALHAMLNGIAWINSGMCNKFLVGGSEAPLTAFTIAQMQALKVYAKQKATLYAIEKSYPCRALDLNKTKNTMVLGEGASMACLEVGETKNALAIIKGFGYATEILEHNISISSDAVCFQKSMQMTLGDTNPEEVDVIVMHAPGTVKGDLSEYNAINKIFCNKTPKLTTNKWKVGHSFGTSGMLSIEMAILMLQHQEFIEVPFIEKQKAPRQIKNILVNAVGFGGNAVSILLSK
ncbi:beta-ketoacyl synthase N-terminal-like domain-containing protein [Mariniflexile sp. HNIBRBA6329]|uniref:beta-ketoacyl synthase N-terminal-like domain-containing protein n=1 Tax=Mariniflexile sp. HNIBRBA6329 TaxID=3373088 RepID=UPI0037465F55